MTITLDDYPPDSPEASEWRQIRDRNVTTLRRRGSFDRFDNPRELNVTALRAEAEHAAGEVSGHAEALATLSAAGWALFPDVSEHQGAFNWQWCKDAGMRIGAYKVSEGRTYLDAQQARNAAEIRRLGLAGMAYTFVFWSAEYDANPALWNEQGRFFAQHVPADFAHAIDVEMLCSGRSTDVARVVAGYRTVYPSHPLMIYTNRGLYVNRSKGTPADPASLGLLEWHAGIGNGYYTTATGSLPNEWGGISTLSNSMPGFPPGMVWQFTDHGAVAGQLVDGNAFNGTADDFRRIFITGGVADDMSQADVDAIKAFITTEVDRIVTSRLASAWVRATGYGETAAPAGLISPAGMIYQNFLQLKALLAQIGLVVADDPNLAQITAALTAQSAPLSQAVIAGIRDALPNVDVDWTQLAQVVATQLDQHLGSLRITSDAPQPQPARASTRDLDSPETAEADAGVNLDVTPQGNTPAEG